MRLQNHLTSSLHLSAQKNSKKLPLYCPSFCAQKLTYARHSWDRLYETEIENHTQDRSDEGTVWFDDSSAEDKVVEFLNEKVCELLGGKSTKQNCNFLDLGTGNGHFLFRLREGEDTEGNSEEEGEGEWSGGGWNGKMLGVDYSQKSIEFARRIAAHKGFDEGQKEGRQVEFQWWDIMSQEPSPSILNPNSTNNIRWDVIHDKGTFDAISLSEEKDTDGRRVCESYKERVVPLMREGGLLLITSCNWTEEELNGWFEGGELEVVEKIQYRSFSFGGKKGQSVSSVCYRKGQFHDRS